MSNRSSNSRRAALRAQQEAEAKRQRFNRIVTVAGAVVITAILVFLGIVLFQKGLGGSNQENPPNSTAEYGIKPYQASEKESAPKVVVWEDPQCPFCKYVSDAWSKNLHSLAEKGEISLEYRIVNFLDGQLRNDASLRAARAATLADKYGLFSKYLDQVYANQPQHEGTGFSDKLLREEIPAQIGLSGDQLAEFQTLYDKKATDEFVKQTTAKWHDEKIGGTPVIQVNGTKVDLLRQGENQQLVPVVAQTDEALLAHLKEVAG